ncbi:hypothetical protein RND81_01G219600 [Saponaria officinalis]|uniref:Rho GTPase-activating protein REN1-like n=2 Tax=Magnoliopsida TaxID=3398 RepID=A0AAW1NK62_SAPOF
MMSKPTDSSSQVVPQVDNGGNSGPLVGPSPDHQSSRTRNQVFKSGPLFISSKGIGWTSWKKRWFILTRTSLVFFRSDPSVAPQKGAEVNLTLGGIDLNNSASVDVKVDKKLLTVFFPDGRDGRAFTLKSETLEDLNEWKIALENAIQLAPSAAQNGLLKNEQADTANGSADQQKDKPPSKSMVIGRPILLALEDIDGSPSFLEKALRFVEDHGVKVEGILRQAADVDDVHRRVHEYEQGKTEFSKEEDAHVIADCIKYILRELPSSPVPASCCNALLEAFRTDRNNRLNAMRTAILETFPEPNRRLLQRILLMMQTIASNKTVNRMSTSAVAACMSPLLLRPLLAGDCELENTHMDVAGDGSLQLLQAAAAANHAQAIIITLLDEYDNIFGEGSMSAELFSDSDDSGTGTEATDDGTYDEDDEDDEDEDDEDEDGYLDDDDNEYASDDHDDGTEDDYEHSVTETCSESGDQADSDSDEKPSRSSSFSETSERATNHIARQRSPSSSPLSPAPQKERQGSDNNLKRNNDKTVDEVGDVGKSRKHTNVDTTHTSSENDSASPSPRVSSQMSSTKVLGTSQVRNPRWGRQSAKRNLSMESIDFTLEDEDEEIQRLEAAKIDLQNKIAEEANGNAILQASLERRKKALHERRLALEKDVTRLQEQLQKEKDLRAALEAGSKVPKVPSSGNISDKTKNDLRQIAIAEENFNNLKQRFDDLGAQLSHQHEHNAALLHDRLTEIEDTSSHLTTTVNSKDREMKGTSNHVERSSRDDVTHRNFSIDRDYCDYDWNNESSFSNKNQNQPHDTSRVGLPKFGWLPNNSHSSESSVTKSNTSASKKPSSKGEGSNSTSALSKLTNRLNFLKERRNQIASELQFIDKTKGFFNPPALSPGKGKAPELPITHSSDKNQDDRTHQSSQSSANWMSTESDNKKNDSKKNSNSKSDATSSYGTGRGTANEGDNKDSSKRSDNKRSDAPSSTDEYDKDSNKKIDDRSCNLRSDVPSSYSSGKGMPNESDKIDGFNKDGNKKNDDKRSSNSRSDAPLSYSSGKGVSNEGDVIEGDKSSSKKNDKKRSSKSRSDAPSSYSSGKGMPNESEKTEEYKKNNDNKRSSDSRSDVPSSYSSAKDCDKRADNKDGNKKGSSSKPDAPLSHNSDKAVTTEGDNIDYSRKTENKSSHKKGFFSSKNNASQPQNVDQGRKSDTQSSQHLDRAKSEAQSSRNSDKSRNQDSQHSSSSRTLSRGLI